jgi:hypothetical protein
MIAILKQLNTVQLCTSSILITCNSLSYSSSSCTSDSLSTHLHTPLLKPFNVRRDNTPIHGFLPQIVFAAAFDFTGIEGN